MRLLQLAATEFTPWFRGQLLSPEQVEWISLTPASRDLPVYSLMQSFPPCRLTSIIQQRAIFSSGQAVIWFSPDLKSITSIVPAPVSRQEKTKVKIAASCTKPSWNTVEKLPGKRPVGCSQPRFLVRFHLQPVC
ncbi:MAG: hypothetical protein R3C11_10640 [Planctomycetaceae bacterium]